MNEKKPGILIVDDETKNIQALGVLLQTEGYNIYVAQNGRDALETANEVNPDLILLDVMMPGIKGFDVCRILQSSPETKDIPVIFLTAMSETEDIVKGFEIGASDYVCKPFRSVELLARVRNHLNLRILHQSQKKKNRQLAEKILELQKAKAFIRESEERFRSIFEYSADIIFLLDIKGNILDANPAATENLEYKYEVLLNLNIKDIDKHFAENKSNILSAQPIDLNPPLLIETDYIRKNRSYFPVEIRMTQMPLNGEKVFALFARDIQTRKQREAEILRKRKLESLGIFAGGIAHDFNNLLFIISGNVELIEQEIYSDSVINHYIKEIENAAFKAADVTQKMMIFAKGGEPVIQDRTVNSLVENLLFSLELNPKISVHVNLPETLWLSQLDEKQMTQVLLNLVNNAQDAMPGGGIITISAQNIICEKDELRSDICIKPGKYIEISIRDQGSGIPEKYLHKIFDPYFSSKERGVSKGMGLGLAVAYSIILKHQGYIYVKSSVPFGTTFVIIVPASVKNNE